MAYQHPLHYLLGLEGAALLRAYAGAHDRAFAEARVAGIRRLLEHPVSEHDGVETAEATSADGYRVWSATYDRPGNGLFPFEEPFVDDVLASIKPGTALDAACGTGRHAARLDARGHQVIGVDSSPEMLALARTRLPGASFRLGALNRLPITDGHVDVVVCGLALTHVHDLGPVFAEFARVLRPGGHLIVTDVHHETVALGSVPHVRLHGQQPALLTAYRHRASDYLAAALPQGFELRRMEEPGGRPQEFEPRRMEEPGGRPPLDASPADEPGEWDTWPWTLSPMVPEAAGAVWSDARVTSLWHFQTGEGPVRPDDPTRDR